MLLFEFSKYYYFLRHIILLFTMLIGIPCFLTGYSYSLIETLEAIRDKGIKTTLEEQRERYRCARCGGIVCIHNGKCYNCDEVKSWRG